MYLLLKTILKKEKPTATSGGCPFSTISWFSICYHRRKEGADSFDDSNTSAMWVASEKW